MFTWYCVESLQWNPCIQFDVKPQPSWFIIKVIVIEVKTDLCNTLQQCVDEWHLGSSSAWHPSSGVSPGPPGPSHCILQYPADVGSDWGDADQPDYSLHRTIWRESDTRRLTLTLLFRGLRGSCVVIRSGAENVRWSVLTRREETLPVPLVSMTTVSWQLLLCDPLWSSEVQFLFVFYLTSGLQRRRMWVMTSWGQDGVVTRAFLKSRESFNSKRSERPFKEDGSLGGSVFAMTNVTRQNKTRTERQTHLLQWKESIICF